MNKVLILLTFSFFGLFPNKKVEAQDWPNLSKYQQENIALKLTENHGNRVVFMGNSITEGWAEANPEFFTGNPYINRGIGGQTTPQMLLRFRQDVIDLNPKLVVILAGTNDIAGNTGPMSLEQIVDNILSMVQLSKANDIQPILCSVLPAFDYPWRPGLEPNIKIPKLNQLLREIAKKEEALYVDYFSAMADDRNGLPKHLAEDGVHPTKKGYKIMEGLIKPILKKALASESGE
nr:SGNH/GDSL hydrolase family protein [Allomuricauda sp.]